MARMLLTAGIVALIALGAAGFYMAGEAAPSCGDEQVVHTMTDTLRGQFHLDGLFVNNITSVSGGFFSDRRQCSAEVAEIRNMKASDMPWRSVQYRIERRRDSDRPAISVQMGGSVPLAKPGPSFWEQLMARF
jgi:hypothetical protein